VDRVADEPAASPSTAAAKRASVCARWAVDHRHPHDAEEPVTWCSIITTTADREVRVVHDRMPVILDGPDAEAAWLSAGVDLDGRWSW
jgi:putative SOS response-associated peptidase YedK